MTDYSWLSRITEEAYERTRDVFACDYEGQRLTIATDGRRLIAVEGQCAPLDSARLDMGGNKGTIRQLLTLLTPAKGARVTRHKFSDLAAWVGATALHACPLCDATGRVEQLYDWEDLMHVDLTEEPYIVRLGRVHGILINRELLALPCAKLESEEVEIATNTAKAPLLFIGEGWRMLLMPCADEGEQVDDFPPAPLH